MRFRSAGRRYLGQIGITRARRSGGGTVRCPALPVPLVSCSDAVRVAVPNGPLLVLGLSGARPRLAGPPGVRIRARPPLQSVMCARSDPSRGHGATPPPGSGRYCFRSSESSSHSSACERARCAASRACSAPSRSLAAASLRPACSCLWACSSARAALSSSTSAVQLPCLARRLFRLRGRQDPLLDWRSEMLRTGPTVISLAVVAVLVAEGAASAGGRARQVSYKRCRHERLSVRGTGGHSLRVNNLRVHAISCARAAAALRASTFEATPAGPLFSTRGFKCGGPVGPPPAGAKPRYYHCKHQRQLFEFLVPGFS